MAASGDILWTEEAEVQDFRFKELRKISFGDSGVEGCIDQRFSLLCTSNHFGLTFVGCKTGVYVFRTALLYEVDKDEHLGKKNVIAGKSSLGPTHIPIPAPPINISLSSDSFTLSVYVKENGLAKIYFYDTRSLSNKGKPVESFCSIALPTDKAAKIVDLQWNPSPEYAYLLAVVLSTGTVALLEVKDDVGLLVKRENLPANCFCWSPKGKQFALGMKNGDVVQLAPKNFEEKRRYPPPDPSKINPDNKLSQVADLHWLSSFEFAVTYIPQDQNCMHSVLGFLSTAKDKPVSFNCSDDPYGYCFTVGNKSRVDKFHFNHIPSWSVLITCSNNSVELAQFGRDQGEHGVATECDNASYRGPWWQWSVDEGGRAGPPMHSDNSETYTMGMTIDYTSQEVVPINDTTILPCSPLFLLYTDRGILCPYTIINTGCPPEKITELIRVPTPLPTSPIRQPVKQSSQPPPAPAPTQAPPRTAAPQTSTPGVGTARAPPGYPGVGLTSHPTGPSLLTGQRMMMGGGANKPGMSGVPLPLSSQGAPRLASTIPALGTPTFGLGLGGGTASATAPTPSSVQGSGLFLQGGGPKPLSSPSVNPVGVPPARMPSPPAPGLGAGMLPRGQTPTAPLRAFVSQAGLPASSTLRGGGLSMGTTTTPTQHFQRPPMGGIHPPHSTSTPLGAHPQTAALASMTRTPPPAVPPSGGTGLLLGGASGLMKSGPPISTGPRPSVPAASTPPTKPPPVAPLTTQPPPPVTNQPLPSSATSGVPYTRPMVTMTPATPIKTTHTPAKPQTGAKSVDQEQVEKQFAKHIQDEIGRFSEEMDEVENEVRSLVCVEEGRVKGLGGDRELTVLTIDINMLRDKMREQAKVVKGFEQCSDLATEETLQGFEVSEKARTWTVKKEDPKFASLMKVRPLDSYSTKRLNSLRALFLQVSRAIDELNAQLDTQLEKKYEERRQRGKNLLKAPSIQTVYSTLRDQHRLIRLQGDCVSALVSDMKRLRIIPRSWQSAAKDVQASPKTPASIPNLHSTPREREQDKRETTPSRPAVDGEKRERLRETLHAIERTPVKKVRKAHKPWFKVSSRSTSEASQYSHEGAPLSEDTPDAPPTSHTLTPRQYPTLSSQISSGSHKPAMIVSPDRKVAVRTQQGAYETVSSLPGSGLSTPQLSRRSSGPDLIVSSDGQIAGRDSGGQYVQVQGAVKPPPQMGGHSAGGPGHGGTGHVTMRPSHATMGSGHVTMGSGHVTMGPGHVTVGPGHVAVAPSRVGLSGDQSHYSSGKGTVHWGSPPSKSEAQPQSKAPESHTPLLTTVNPHPSQTMPARAAADFGELRRTFPHGDLSQIKPPSTEDLPSLPHSSLSVPNMALSKTSQSTLSILEPKSAMYGSSPHVQQLPLSGKSLPTPTSLPISSVTAKPSDPPTSLSEKPPLSSQTVKPSTVQSPTPSGFSFTSLLSNPPLSSGLTTTSGSSTLPAQPSTPSSFSLTSLLSNPPSSSTLTTSAPPPFSFTSSLGGPTTTTPFCFSGSSKSTNTGPSQPPSGSVFGKGAPFNFTLGTMGTFKLPSTPTPATPQFGSFAQNGTGIDTLTTASSIRSEIGSPTQNGTGTSTLAATTSVSFPSQQFSLGPRSSPLGTPSSTPLFTPPASLSSIGSPGLLLSGGKPDESKLLFEMGKQPPLGTSASDGGKMDAAKGSPVIEIKKDSTTDSASTKSIVEIDKTQHSLGNGSERAKGTHSTSTFMPTSQEKESPLLVTQTSKPSSPTTLPPPVTQTLTQALPTTVPPLVTQTSSTQPSLTIATPPHVTLTSTVPLSVTAAPLLATHTSSTQSPPAPSKPPQETQTSIQPPDLSPTTTVAPSTVTSTQQPSPASTAPLVVTQASTGPSPAPTAAPSTQAPAAVSVTVPTLPPHSTSGEPTGLPTLTSIASEVESGSNQVEAKGEIGEVGDGSGAGDVGGDGSGDGDVGGDGSGAGDVGGDGSGDGNVGGDGSGAGDVGGDGSGAGDVGGDGSGAGDVGGDGSGAGDGSGDGSGAGDVGGDGSGAGDASSNASRAGDVGGDGSEAGDVGGDGSGAGDVGGDGSEAGDVGGDGSGAGDVGGDGSGAGGKVGSGVGGDGSGAGGGVGSGAGGVGVDDSGGAGGVGGSEEYMKREEGEIDTNSQGDGDDEAMMGDDMESIDDSTGLNQTPAVEGGLSLGFGLGRPPPSSVTANPFGTSSSSGGFGLGRPPPTNVTTNPFGTPSSSVTSPSSYSGVLKSSALGGGFNRTQQPSPSTSMFGSGGLSQSSSMGQSMFGGAGFGQKPSFGSPPSIGTSSSTAMSSRIFGSGSSSAGGSGLFGNQSSSEAGLTFGGLAGSGGPSEFGGGGSSNAGFGPPAGNSSNNTGFGFLAGKSSTSGVGGNQGNLSGNSFSGWRQ